MKALRYLDPDKITYGTYYQSLLLCQRNDPTALPASESKHNYIPSLSEIEAIEHRRAAEHLKEASGRPSGGTSGAQPQDSGMNTGFRRGSAAEDDFESFSD